MQSVRTLLNITISLILISFIGLSLFRLVVFFLAAQNLV